ncbi:TIM barrel protein [Pseudactinotalea sp. HY160]|uniref:sugar phosphate isomerase/epimerase family protein n=1 Tax=Pseudactinotalea sp. HY160 TaxID=2654490 RepID=UPI00130FF4AB|nr:TIM barrel protein [Pseudactinotalea sp. HY160]
MLRPGLCSVTYRELTPAEVIDLARDAGLECIEWAGDVHVPAGDVAGAASVRGATEAAGLAVASYGSYLDFLGSEEEFALAAAGVVSAAAALGAPRIRVWAGRTGSAEADSQLRDLVVARIRHVADLTRPLGIDLGLEFHGHTLTDEVGSTLRLLEEVGRANVLTYWQPHQGMPSADALSTLRRVLERTSTIHAFSWWPMAERLELAERADLWRGAVEILAAAGGDHDVLLEFVPDDDPSLLASEAATLREWLHP